MRDFFIRSFERLIGAIIVLSAVGLLIFAIVGAANAPSGGQGILVFLATIVFGGLYLILIGGAMYLALGIYHNTLRAANALDRTGGRM